jgi:hypothetical protein
VATRRVYPTDKFCSTARYQTNRHIGQATVLKGWPCGFRVCLAKGWGEGRLCCRCLLFFFLPKKRTKGYQKETYNLLRMKINQQYLLIYSQKNSLKGSTVEATYPPPFFLHRLPPKFCHFLSPLGRDESLDTKSNQKSQDPIMLPPAFLRAPRTLGRARAHGVRLWRTYYLMAYARYQKTDCRALKINFFLYSNPSCPDGV